MRFLHESHRRYHRKLTDWSQQITTKPQNPTNGDTPAPSDHASASDTPTLSPSPHPGSGNTSAPTIGTSESPSTPTAPYASSQSNSPTPALNTLYVALSLIDLPASTNSRIDLDRDRITDLAQSLQSVGQLHAVTLRPHGDRYQLIAGHRRALAAKRLNWTHIHALVLTLTDHQADTARLAENALREQLTPIDEAAQLHDMINAHPDGVDGVALALGRSATWILNRLDLLTMPDALQRAIHTGSISIAAATRLARIQPPPLRDQRIADASHHGINARTAALWLQDSQQSAAPQPTDLTAPPDPGPPAYQTETRARCTLCSELHPIAQTQNIRICNECHTTLAQLLQSVPPNPTT